MHEDDFQFRKNFFLIYLSLMDTQSAPVSVPNTEGGFPSPRILLCSEHPAQYTLDDRCVELKSSDASETSLKKLVW